MSPESSGQLAQRSVTGVDAEAVATEITVAGANCPWCFNETVELLRREPGVVSVDASLGGQCIRVNHTGADLDRLLAVVQDHLHAEATYAAERVMVGIEPRVSGGHCTHRRPSTPVPEAGDV